MVALAISSVVVTGMYRTFIQQQRVSTQQEQLTEARQNARLSMDAMSEEIREAGFVPADLLGQALYKQTAPACALLATRIAMAPLAVHSNLMQKVPTTKG